jgi:hypothetical protein
VESVRLMLGFFCRAGCWHRYVAQRMALARKCGSEAYYLPSAFRRSYRDVVALLLPCSADSSASVVAPIDKLSVVFSILLVTLILGEPVTWRLTVGGGLVTSGVLLLAWPSGA